MAQIHIGALSAAERNLRRSIKLCREIKKANKEAHDHAELLHILVYCGMWNESDDEFKQALEMCEQQNDIQSQSVIWSYRALRFLLMTRSNPQLSIANCKSAIECAQRALESADETTRTWQPFPRDYVGAYWLLGAAYRMNNELTLAEENLSKALNLCRQINLVDHEANILLNLARLSFAYALRAERSRSPSAQDRLQHFKDAQEKASEVLMITERSGYVLQGADVNLFLAELALEGYKLQVTSSLSNKEAAIFHAETALKLAHCDDGPPYYYKVAYEEAEQMLERMKAEG